MSCWVRRRILFLLALTTVGSDPGWGQVPRDGVEHPEIFAKRRAEFARRLGEGVAVFHSKPVYNRNDDIDYPYRQDSDFYYLTGFEEPEAVAVLRSDGGGKVAYTLFVRPRDPDQEIWTGHRWGPDGAVRVFKADRSYVIDSLPSVMPRLLSGAQRVLYSSGGDVEFGARLRGWTGPGGPGTGEIGPRPGGREIQGPDSHTPDASASAGFPSPLPIVHEMRVIHAPEEVARLQRAVDITEQAHRASMRAAKPGLYEYQLEALQYYLYRTLGSERYGFPSIVASGPNSVTLHYEENNRRLTSGDLIVLDIGAEYAMYSADVTRTIPASGKFTPEQRQIHDIVSRAQDAAMKEMRPGRTIQDAHRRAVEVVTEGLVKLGLLRGSVQENIASGAYMQFFMHGTSHWIGLDVHDAGSYTEPDGSPRVFRPGMILSNEPGIYIREGTPGVDPKWFNIGVRLENDVLVTDGEPVDMTARIPRTAAEVEAEMAKPPLTLDTGQDPAALPPPEQRLSASADGDEPVSLGTVAPAGRGKKK